MWTWGYGTFGELGLGYSSNHHSPMLVAGLSGRRVSRIGSGFYHTMAATGEPGSA